MRILRCGLRLVVSIGLLLNTHNIYAAAPITHTFLAETWMQHKEHYSEKQKQAFILGTLFPDIRYLGVIARDKTHEYGLTISELEKNQVPFNKGKRLHAWIDETRESLVVKWGIYSKLKKIKGQKYKATFLKLLEDEILYTKRDWRDVRRYLLNIDPHEKRYGIALESLQKWHHVLGAAFSHPPSVHLTNLSQQEKGYAGVPYEVIKSWQKELPKFAARKDMQEYVKDLVSEFSYLFSER